MKSACRQTDVDVRLVVLIAALLAVPSDCRTRTESRRNTGSRSRRATIAWRASAVCRTAGAAFPL